MNDVAASDDEDAFIAQVRQFLAEREVEFRALYDVEAELQHRDIRRGIHMPEDRPGPVIEAPEFIVWVDGRVRRIAADAFSSPRVAGGRVLNIEKLLGKPVEVMDGFWILHMRHPGALGHPVRGDAEDGFGPGKPFPQLTELSRKRRVANRVHRASVPDENDRHPVRRRTLAC